MIGKKQKIALIISIVIFFAWIVTLSVLLQGEYEGNMTNSIFTACVGCGGAIALYISIFVYKKKLDNMTKEQELYINQKIKNVLIAVLYVDILGFFMMSVATLLNAYDQKEVVKFGWVGFSVLITMLALIVAVVWGYLSVAGAVRRIQCQNANDNLNKQ